MTREQPWAVVPQLRVLIGELRRRASDIPIYETGPHGGERLAGQRKDSDRKVEVFHVLGWGRTLEEAKARMPVSSRSNGQSPTEEDLNVDEWNGVRRNNFFAR